MNKDFRFIRKNGRVIPIRISQKQKSDAIKGAALTAGGVATAAASGYAYPKVLNFANQMSKRAFNSVFKARNFKMQPVNPRTAANRVARMTQVTVGTDKLFKASTQISKFLPALRIGGVTAGSLLVAAGLTKLHQASGRKSKAERTAFAAGGSTVATAAFLTAGYGGPGLRQSVKGLYTKAYPVIRALKLKYRL